MAKNPEHRWASVADMIRAVEALYQPVPAAQVSMATSQAVPQLNSPGAPAESPPAMNARQALSELCTSLLLTILFALITVPLWATLGQVRDLNLLGGVFFLTVATTWAVLIPSRVWAGRKGDPWTRRVLLLLLGGAVGLLALWLDGWTPGNSGLGERAAR